MHCFNSDTWFLNNESSLNCRLCSSLYTLGSSIFKLNIESYRAFSQDVMLSSNMAASIATAINIHLCKRLFTLLCLMISPQTSPSVVEAHDDHVHAWCTWLPWISRSVCAIQRPCWRTAWHQSTHSIATGNNKQYHVNTQNYLPRSIAKPTLPW